MNLSPDEKLIAQFLETGEKEFVAELFERYRHLVFGACIKYLGSEDAASDVTMDVFEKILRLESYDYVDNFNSWIYSVVKNCCLDYLRRKKKARLSPKSFNYFNNGISGLHGEDTVLRIFNEEPKKYGKEELRKAMRKLDPIQRKCLNLFFYKHLTYKEIGRKLAIQENRVKSILQNGKRMLRKIMTED